MIFGIHRASQSPKPTYHSLTCICAGSSVGWEMAVWGWQMVLSNSGWLAIDCTCLFVLGKRACHWHSSTSTHVHSCMGWQMAMTNLGWLAMTLLVVAKKYVPSMLFNLHICALVFGWRMAMATLSSYHLPLWLAFHKVAYASLCPSTFVFLHPFVMSILILEFCPLARCVHRNYSRCGSLSHRHFTSMHNTLKHCPNLPTPIWYVDFDVVGEVPTTLHMGLLANKRFY